MLMSSNNVVLLGGFSHESNTFSPLTMKAEEFWMYHSDFTALKSDGGEYTGAIQRLMRLGYRPLPVIATGSKVGGVIERRLLDRYMMGLTSILDQVDSTHVVGIQWVLHGSSRVDGVRDVQAKILKTLRDRFPAVPLVVSMDLHSTVTAEMVQLVDGLVHYRTAPHRDVEETGGRAADMLNELITSDLETERVAIKLPLLLPGEFGQTDSSVMKEITQRIEEFRNSSGALDVSLSQGFPWADEPDGVVTVVGVWTKNTLNPRLREQIRKLAQEVWEIRHDLYRTVTLHTVDALAGIKSTVRPGVGYTVFCDTGDNPTAGAPEDRVDVLEEVLQRNISDVFFVPIVDAYFVHQCLKVPRGALLTASLGGTLSNTPSLTVAALVLRTGRNDLMGSWAVVDINGNWVLVTELRFGVSSPALLVDCGFELDALPETMVVKSGYLFPPWKTFLRIHEGRELLLGTKGPTTLDVSTLPYEIMPGDNFPRQDQSGEMLEIYVSGRHNVSCEGIPLQ